MFLQLIIIISDIDFLLLVFFCFNNNYNTCNSQCGPTIILFPRVYIYQSTPDNMHVPYIASPYTPPFQFGNNWMASNQKQKTRRNLAMPSTCMKAHIQA